MNCCTSITDRGCFYSCDILTTGVSADTTGDYTLVIMPDGQQVVTNTITAANEVVFAGGFISGSGITVFKVLQPDGTFLLSGTADCFQVDITPAFDPSLSVVACAEFDVEYGGDIDNDFINH